LVIMKISGMILVRVNVALGVVTVSFERCCTYLRCRKGLRVLDKDCATLRYV
jgi:hypothetical protein